MNNNKYSRRREEHRKPELIQILEWGFPDHRHHSRAKLESTIPNFQEAAEELCTQLKANITNFKTTPCVITRVHLDVTEAVCDALTACRLP